MQVSAETQTHEHYFHELMKVDRPMTKLDTYGDPRFAPSADFCVQAAWMSYRKSSTCFAVR